MKLVTRLASLFTFAATLAACDQAPPLLPECPPNTDFSPCAMAGEATCYVAPTVEHGGDPLTPVVGCSLPTYNIAECVAECVH